MGLFSSKKTYSGVGSAVQNLLANELTNNLNTVTYSAILNNNDIGETFKNYLKSGTGSRLRSLIDYAHQKGYTNTLGWKVSDITGEVFSDSTAYTNYLHKYVYPTTVTTETTPETVVKDTVTNISNYSLGNDQVTEKTYTRTTTKTVTTTSTNYNLTPELYYQGTHTEFLAVNNLINSDVYQNLSDEAKDSAISVSGDICVLKESHDMGYFKDVPNVAMLLITPKKIKKGTYETIPTTVNGTLVATQREVLDEKVTYTHVVYGQDWNDESYDEKVTFETALWYEDYFGYWSWWRNNSVTIRDPINALNLNDDSAVNLCKVQFILSNTNTTPKEGDEDYSPAHNQFRVYPVWFEGYALITGFNASATKVLVANYSVNKLTTKSTSVITSEYVITEKYINGVLVSSNSVDGATSSESSTQTLEDTTVTHINSYTYGSGNSLLDNIIDNTKSITEQFMPVMPIKTWGTLCNKNWGDLYTAERKLYKKLSGKTLNKWNEFVESFKDVGDDAKMVYYLPAIPINVDHEFANEYLFHFFKWLAVNYNGMNYFGSTLSFGLWATTNIDFMIGYNFKVTYKMVKGTVPVPCKTHNYARYAAIGSGEPNDSVNLSWQGGFKDAYIKFYRKKYASITEKENFTGKREDYPDLSDDEYNQLVKNKSYTVIRWQNAGISSLTFYYKINDNLYEKVYITNFAFYHYVRGTALTYFLKNSLSKDWRAAIDDEATNTANAGFSPIIIPIARGALESMGWYRQSNILEVCHNVVISGYDQKTIKTKWYQSGLFSLVLIIVVVVISIYTAGAGAAAASSATSTTAGTTAGAATAGATAGSVAAGITIAKIADMAIQMIACAIIAKVITYAADKYLGGVFGTIVGVVVTVVACYYATGYYQQNLALSGTTAGKATSLWDYLNSWDGYMELTKTTLTNSMDYLNTMQQNQFNELANQYNAFYQDQAEKSEQMRLWTLEQNSYGKSIYTDIITYNTYTSSSYNRDAMSFTLAEDPDTFHKRTMDLPLRYQEASLAYVYQFEDLTNSLIIA